MSERVVVVGGDAGGMSAASQALRTAAATGRELEIVAFERGPWTSYSACGIPYWVGGQVDGPDALIARSPAQHRANGIDVRLRTEVTGIDLAARTVTAYDHESGREYAEGFDHLVLATGAEPVRPALPGIDAAGVHGVQTLADGQALVARLTAGRPARAVVVGGGYIGLEVAEALVQRGLPVTLLARGEQPMDSLDPDMGAYVHERMERYGIDVVTGAEVEEFERGRDGHVSAVRAGGRSWPADIVVLGLGVRPATALAAAAGLPLGVTNAQRVDGRLAVPGHDGVWAAGDCVEAYDRVSGRWSYVPLGTTANKQGRVLGTNLGGGTAAFPGIVRTAVTRVCDLEIGRTGLTEQDARELGIRYVTGTIESTTRAGYMPGAAPVIVKMLAEQGSGRVLGAQIAGREGAAKRIDVVALALWNGMTAADLSMADLGYAPPFSPVWDPVLVAARNVAARVAEGG